MGVAGRAGPSHALSARRLRRHAEFTVAQRTGKRAHTPHFVLLVAAQPAPERQARLGLIVSRQVGIAVRRNRVKRLCRECFRTWPELLPDGVDLLVIARAGAHELDLPAVRAEWQKVAGLVMKRAAEVLSRAAGARPQGSGG